MWKPRDRFLYEIAEAKINTLISTIMLMNLMFATCLALPPNTLATFGVWRILRETWAWAGDSELIWSAIFFLAAVAMIFAIYAKSYRWKGALAVPNGFLWLYWMIGIYRAEPGAIILFVCAGVVIITLWLGLRLMLEISRLRAMK